MLIRRIPIDFVIMGIRMFISTVVICFMPLDFRTTITSNFCSEYLAVAHYDLLRNLWSNLLRNLCYNLRSDLKQLSFYVQILLDDLGML